MRRGTDDTARPVGVERLAMVLHRLGCRAANLLRVLVVLTAIGPTALTATEATPPATDQLQAASLFTDHMVVQMDQTCPVWGWAKPAARITVTLATQTATVTAGTDGRWQAELPPQRNADGLTLSITDGVTTLRFIDVAIGEVWLASGQSNMTLGLAKDDKVVVNPAIRYFRVETRASAEPLTTCDGTWRSGADLTALGRMPGVPYFFARDLQAARGVTVGIIVSAVGGTALGRWMNPAAIATTPELKDMAATDAKRRASYLTAQTAWLADDGPGRLAAWEVAAAKAKAEGKAPPTIPRGPSTEPLMGRFFLGMVAPLQPYAIRGVIFYQGESDINNTRYQAMFTNLITAWRQDWKRPDLPFLFVQIAADVGNDALIRDAQRRVAQTVPSTAMVVTIDGEVGRHPPHKAVPAARLVACARAIAYGEKIDYSSPLFTTATADGDCLVLHFSDTAGGLVMQPGKGDAVLGFTVAGEDRTFHPATATIVGDTMVVQSDAVSRPVAVRYACESVPTVNLFSKAGLPVSPFKSDDWPMPMTKAGDDGR